MKTIFHAASSRGHADHGWLNAHHSFSFANWYDPSRINFGMLRVLNDDIVAGAASVGDLEGVTVVGEGAVVGFSGEGAGDESGAGFVQDGENTAGGQIGAANEVERASERDTSTSVKLIVTRFDGGAV